MDRLSQKDLTTKAGMRYVYYTQSPKGIRPTLLLCHGCPDTAALWSDFITNHLLPAGYGVLAPDLIGYGSSDKPSGVENYALDKICLDLVQILDHESLSRVVVLGHDFGSALASRMCSFHPDRVSGLVTLGTAYTPPSPKPLDFESIRAMQEKYQGYCSSWYFPLFISEHGANFIDAQLENMFTACHGGGDRFKEVLCTENGIETWLANEDNKDASVLPYATDKFRREWIGRLQRDSWRGPLSWYKAMLSDLEMESQLKALQAGNHVVKVPILFIAVTKDPVALPGAVKPLMDAGMLPDITVRELDTSHWGMLEEPEKFGKTVVGWLDERFSQ